MPKRSHYFSFYFLKRLLSVANKIMQKICLKFNIKKFKINQMHISACPVYAPFAFSNGTLCCSTGLVTGNPVLNNVNQTGVPLLMTNSTCAGNQFDCPLPGNCSNHPVAGFL